MNTHVQSSERQPRRMIFWLLLIALLAGLAYFLLTEHRAHAIAALPWLVWLAVILLCPLMHLFMHRGHGHSGHGGKEHDHES